MNLISLSLKINQIIMKKSVLMLALAMMGYGAFSQDMDAIGKMYNDKKYTEAKTAIDNFLANSKNADNADAWYFKGRIYNSLAADAATPKAQAYDFRKKAFEAFQNYQKYDAKETRLKLDLWTPFLEVYAGLYDLGAAQFNEKDYEGALKSFSGALDVENFILSKKYEYSQIKLHPLDTALVLNAAVAASQAKKNDEAMGFYRKITDANVSEPQYVEVYQVLAEYYDKKKDSVNLAALLEKGRRIYPTNGYWDELELKAISEKGDKETLYARYEELIAKKPNDFTLNYNYAIELYNSIYTPDKRPANEAQLKAKLTTVLKNAITLDKGIDATVLMTNHLYNVAADLSTAATLIKGVKPEDKAKKADLKKQSNEKMDECINYCNSAITWFEAQPSLKTSQKNIYKNVIGYLIDMYGVKGDTKKVADLEKKQASIN